MYNKILTLVLILMSITSNAQKMTDTDLLNLIKREGDVFHIFEKKSHYLNMGKVVPDDLKKIAFFDDFKSAYYNSDLKQELLKLFTDTIGYVNFYIEENINYLKSNKNYTKKTVIEWVKYYYPSFLDSISNSNDLFVQFQDSLIKYESQYYIKNYHNMELSYPSIEILSKIKYPESYHFFYKLWQNDNKSIDSKWFNVMLNFQDPESEKIYFEYVNRCILEHDSMKLLKIINYANTFCDSFHIKLFVYLLDKELSLSDEFNNSRPLQYWLFDTFSQAYSWLLYQNNDLRSIIDSINDSYIIYNNNENLYKKYDKEIKQFYQGIYKSFINQELYWKQNMPYYKQEQDSLNHN